MGAGHVGKAFAHLAKWSGFYVVVSDDRLKMDASTEHIEADEVLFGPMDQIPTQLHLTDECYIVLTTRSADLDIQGLPVLLDSPAQYIGVIGSKRRWAVTQEALQQKSISETLMQKIHTPVGLPIGAETPEEIAVSIMAEIIQFRHKNSRGF